MKERSEVFLAMRVKMLFCPEQGYDIDERNPAIGTPWECAGTVIRLAPEGIYVKWDNGCTNVYVACDLTPEDSSEKVENFRSIW